MISPFRWFLIWCFCILTEAQDTCLYTKGTAGLCKSYKDCTELHGAVIFPSTVCQPGKICCPSWTQPYQPPKSATTSTLAPALELTAPHTNAPPIKPNTQLPHNNERSLPQNLQPLIQAAYPIEIVTTTTTELPTTESFGDNFNPLGLNVLRTQKCGFVYASKNPNGTNIEAEILEYPWMVLLQYEDANGQREFGCGGSLITERWVLTAAQCIKPNLIAVRLGEYNIQENTKNDCTQANGIRMCTKYQDFKIIKSGTHPEFNQQSGLKDIGLIKLKTRVQRNKNIKPICLPTQKEHFDAPYDENNILIAGWKSRKIDSSTILKKNRVQQQNPMVCDVALLFRYNNRDASKLCLDSGVDQLNSTCSADPGSPVFWLVQGTTNFYTQIGIVPFDMDKCGAGQDVPYFAERVADSMDWITSVLRDDN